jgi:hypothetical protein
MNLECPNCQRGEICFIGDKLNSTVNLNKRVSRAWSKNKGADKKSGSNKSRKNNGKSNNHPKTWPAPKGDKKGAGGHFISVVGHQLQNVQGLINDPNLQWSVQALICF